jgi:hypothetical protein
LIGHESYVVLAGRCFEGVKTNLPIVGDRKTSFRECGGRLGRITCARADERLDGAFATTGAIEFRLLPEERGYIEIRWFRAATADVSNRWSSHDEYEDGREMQDFDATTNRLFSNFFGNFHGNTSKSTTSPAVAETTGYVGYFFSHVLAP